VLTLLWLLATPGHAIASAMAGLAVAAPNAFFAWRIAAGRPDSDGVDEARRLIGSGIAKSLLGAGLLVAIFVAYQPEPAAFFVTLIGVQAVHWTAPLFDVPRRIARSERSRTEQT
jgi:F0F1-type ATP synthase assembly protein I